MNLLSVKKQNGFTLIETLFSVLIFSASIVALMTIAGKGISATSNAREQIVAHYLAQEGLETVRNMRDSTFAGFSSDPWSFGFENCTTNNPCQVRYEISSGLPPVIVPCTSGCAVFENLSEGVYVDGDSQGAPTVSPYTRKITAELGSNPEEYQIFSTVEWVAKGIKRNVTLTTLLKKWR